MLRIGLRPQSDKMVDMLKKATSPGAVILLHDSIDKAKTVAASATMIPWWKKQGYRLETIPPLAENNSARTVGLYSTKKSPAPRKEPGISWVFNHKSLGDIARDQTRQCRKDCRLSYAGRTWSACGPSDPG